MRLHLGESSIHDSFGLRKRGFYNEVNTMEVVVLCKAIGTAYELFQ
jgi:hypothetical protein